MKKVLIFLLTCLPLCICAQSIADQPDIQLRLDEARELYFAGKPQQALEQYVEISKDTQHRDAFLNAAFIALEQGNPKQAVDISTSAYLLYPQDKEITEFVAEAYLADGQYENAEKFFSFLQEEGERSEFLLIHLARAQLGMGESALAIRNLKQAAAGKNHTPLANY
ncbi:MAG: tetratricopeptide repeat protein, partial [Elusimicrobiaceae bacterium]|nr:tetratricopeptide repeat protein [Elusimicrobiaceae bacterium]